MSYLRFLVSLVRPTIQSTAIIEPTRNRTGNGPAAPAFFVVAGTVVTAGAIVPAVVVITVGVRVAFCGASILA